MAVAAIRPHSTATSSVTGASRVGFLERNAPHDLAERQRAEMERPRLDRAQPSNGLPTAAAGLGHDVRVDKIHS